MSRKDPNLVGKVIQHKNGDELLVTDVRGDDASGSEVVVHEIGSGGLVSPCPVNHGDDCIRPDCGGIIYEQERDQETQTANSRWCPECGLIWTNRGGSWREKDSDFYVDWRPDTCAPEQVDIKGGGGE